MSSYAENEQDAREYAELKAQFEAEKQDELDAERKAKPVVHMNAIMEHRRRVNNLGDLKEQLQEDMITYIDGKAFLYIEQFKDDLCQIIVDRVTELQDNLEENQCEK